MHLKAFQLKMATSLMVPGGCAGDAAISTQEALGACLLQIRPTVGRQRSSSRQSSNKQDCFQTSEAKCVVY